MAYWITTSAAIKYYMLATMSGDREVGGFFEYRIDEHGNVIVIDLTALRQESTSVYFEISEKVKALWLEEIVGKGKNPANFGLFHTHPSGMDAGMSGVDVKQLVEMATDLPGIVARSMILPQGRLVPTMHEAVCVEGRVFRRDNCPIKLLDDTGATDELKSIGWFDKPKVEAKVVKQSTGNRELLPVREFTHRDLDYNEGWFDSQHVDGSMGSEYEEWLIEEQQDQEDLCSSYIGELVAHNGTSKQVVDAYIWDVGIVLVLEGQEEVLADEVTIIKSGWLKEETA